jgi:autonomous glycyl radical cofactor GrcA
MEEGEPSLFHLVTQLCANAVANGDGLVLAVDDGYAMHPTPASDVFLRVDAEAAHNPHSTFRNEQLGELLNDALLPTVGVLNASADDAESFALRVGYARDRVYAYQKIKDAALQAKSVEATAEVRLECTRRAEAVRKDLMATENKVMSGNSVRANMLEAKDYNMAKRVAWDARHQPDRTPSLMDNVLATGLTRSQIVGLSTDKWEDDAPVAAECDAKLGTERFVALAFAPRDHEVLIAANATGGGVRIDDQRLSYPAYVTVHNSKGAIEHLPATEAEAHPNSVIVPCAASLICELHALSSKAQRNHVLIAHQV